MDPTLDPTLNEDHIARQHLVSLVLKKLVVCIFDEYLGEANLPVMCFSLEHSSTDPLGGALEIMDVSHRESGNEHSITLHKLSKRVTNGITSTSNSIKEERNSLKLEKQQFERLLSMSIRS